MEVLRPLDVEVLGGGALQLHGAAAQRAAELGVEVAVSLSHARVTAGAVAVLR
jgi:holo-[acyl-carrier protein] synthase